MAVTKTYDKARKAGALVTASAQYVRDPETGVVSASVTGTVRIEYLSTDGDVEVKTWKLQDLLTAVELGSIKKLLDDKFLGRVTADGMTVT